MSDDSSMANEVTGAIINVTEIFSSYIYDNEVARDQMIFTDCRILLVPQTIINHYNPQFASPSTISGEGFET